ncbi:hypothetical protein ABT010_38125 [Streptomyces sp. NPDC002668]|uniref:hypothetical protein n=1 Tax=Streptomyces sp. NPDC002668 TaxID=3154422 RepID=UPI00332683AF
MRHPATRTVGPHNDEMLQLLAESDVGDVRGGDLVLAGEQVPDPRTAPLYGGMTLESAPEVARRAPGSARPRAAPGLKGRRLGCWCGTFTAMPMTVHASPHPTVVSALATARPGVAGHDDLPTEL